jgi:hypothetical protein
MFSHKVYILSAAFLLSVFAVCQGCKTEVPVITDPDDHKDSTAELEPLTNKTSKDDSFGFKIFHSSDVAGISNL